MVPIPTPDSNGKNLQCDSCTAGLEGNQDKLEQGDVGEKQGVRGLYQKRGT